MLELKDFIKKTLVDIVEGVHEAGNAIDSQKGYIVPKANDHSNDTGRGTKFETAFSQQNIEFDIAVQVSESESGGSKISGQGDIGGKIFVASAKANITKENSSNSEESKETISRIKFVVPVGFNPRFR